MPHLPQVSPQTCIYGILGHLGPAGGPCGEPPSRHTGSWEMMTVSHVQPWMWHMVSLFWSKCFGMWKSYFMSSSQVFRFLWKPVRSMFLLLFFPSRAFYKALFQSPSLAQRTDHKESSLFILLKKGLRNCQGDWRENSITTGKRTGLLCHHKRLKRAGCWLLTELRLCRDSWGRVWCSKLSGNALKWKKQKQILRQHRPGTF